MAINFKTLREKFRDRLNLTSYIDVEAAVENIRSSIYFRGPNVWILGTAIIIASVGLNVNSIPVIIGAMLISPLMGPIIGFGLGLGTNDTALIRNALKNLLVMVVISIFVSGAYFLISPLAMENPTELLARTNPTIYDVLIALFGGLAGIIETSRKEKGTVISGVAIATALMPPLCTVGYGLATFNMHYLFGALYLFTINSIFIALATYLAVKWLHFPVVHYADVKKNRKTRRSIVIGLIIIIIPSVFSAVKVVGENNFNQNAKAFLRENKTLDRTYIYDSHIDFARGKGTLTIQMAGAALSANDRELLYRSAESHRIDRDHLIIKETGLARTDLSENELIQSIFDRTEQETQRRDQQISKLQEELKAEQAKELPVVQIARELKAQYPGIEVLSMGRGSEFNLESQESRDLVIVVIKSANRLDPTTLDRIQKWLATRVESENIRIFNE
jgi:uncharacterized hydrophobic protein (TIGR00271 family)